jgi:chromosome segregation protein
VEARQQEARTAAEEVFSAERQLEAGRRHAMQLLTLAGNARNHTAQGEESLAALEREAERLRAEIGQARNEQETLGIESGQAHLRFESAADALKRLEGEIAALRETTAGQARRRKRQAHAGQPVARRAGRRAGRRDSLESLIATTATPPTRCASC